MEELYNPKELYKYENKILEEYKKKAKRELFKVLDDFIEKLPQIREKAIKDGDFGLELSDGDAIFKSEILNPSSFADLMEFDSEYSRPYDEYDTNGWELDYWASFKYKNIPFTLHGSGYWGGASVCYFEYFKEEIREKEKKENKNELS